MIPLTALKNGEEAAVLKVGGRDDTRRFLESLGFAPGSIVSIVSRTGKDVIVNVKKTRVAINGGMASKILV
jgi:ferrous iron transport protein A